MRRFLTSFLMIAAAAAVFGQGAPFTIVRPADGSKVREKIHILFPKDSIPTNGYVGIFLGGKFFQAVSPPQNGQYVDYVLDSKNVEGPDGPIPDGPLKIEAVLYENFNDVPKVVDRSSITVNVGNHENIDVPEKGFRFAYHFSSGSRWIYNLTETVTTENLTQSQANNEGQGNSTSSNENARLMYSVDNAYGNGDGLIRMQLMPPVGQGSALLTALGSEVPKRYYLKDMKPVYMKVDSHGREQFGAAPAFFPSWTGGVPGTDDVTAIVPFPVLPTAPQMPGSPWTSDFQFPIGNPTSDMHSLVKQVKNRGEFVDVEWEQNHPCAKIHNEFELTDESKAKVSEDVWFALDKQIVVKATQELQIDTKVEPAGGTQQNNAPTQAAQNTGPAPGTMGMRKAGTGGKTNNNNAGSAEQIGRPGGPRGQGGPRGGGAMGPGGRPAGGPPSFGPGGAQNNGNTNNANGRFTGQSAPATKIIRQTFTRTMTLEG